MFPLLLGLAGCAVLLSLGVWQVQRLAWKAANIAAITARIADVPQGLPDVPDATGDKYLAVTATGALDGQALYVLTSQDGAPGYRVVAVLTTAGRRLLADIGFIPVEARGQAMVAPQITLRGHLHWPDETDGWTPAPDGDLWFARAVPAMASVLGTEPVLIVVAEMSPQVPGVTPLPIDTAAIPNDHLGYAVTWFALALVWAVMSGFFTYRMATRPQRTI